MKLSKKNRIELMIVCLAVIISSLPVIFFPQFFWNRGEETLSMMLSFLSGSVVGYSFAFFIILKEDKYNDKERND